MPSSDLTIVGETAIVTAAGRGIGREIASRLTAMGVDVGINDVDESALAETEAALADDPGEVVAEVADVADPDAVAAFVGAVEETFGGIDVLVNNAGVRGPVAPAEDVDPDDFMDTLAVNVGGAFNAAKFAIPALRESPAGRVVNLSSTAGKTPLENRTAYAASKMAVIGLTRTLSRELAPHGVTVNAICPGAVVGERAARTFEKRAAARGSTQEAARAAYLESSPMGAMVQPGDVADMVCFLCSDRADHVTGQDVNVDTGCVVF